MSWVKNIPCFLLHVYLSHLSYLNNLTVDLLFMRILIIEDISRWGRLEADKILVLDCESVFLGGFLNFVEVLLPGIEFQKWLVIFIMFMALINHFLCPWRCKTVTTGGSKFTCYSVLAKVKPFLIILTAR